MWFLYPKTISAEGGRKQKNRRDLLLTHEKPILNQVIDLSWTAVNEDTMLWGFYFTKKANGIKYLYPSLGNNPEDCEDSQITV